MLVAGISKMILAETTLQSLSKPSLLVEEKLFHRFSTRQDQNLEPEPYLLNEVQTKKLAILLRKSTETTTRSKFKNKLCVV